MPIGRPRAAHAHHLGYSKGEAGMEIRPRTNLIHTHPKEDDIVVPGAAHQHPVMTGTLHHH